MHKEEKGQVVLGCLGAVAAVLVFLLVLGSCASTKMVPAGEVGVVTEWGAVTGNVRNPGLHFITPVKDNLVNMSTQTHIYTVHAGAASHDLQTVATDIALNFRLSSERMAGIYQTFRRDIDKRVVHPSVQDAVKAATSQFAASELITQRPLVKQKIEDILRERLSQHGVVVEGVNITNFEFSKDFTEAIEKKVTAEQRAHQAENDLARIKIEAQQQIETARAQAESIRIRSAALAENQRLVEWEAVQKWNGVLPQYMLGGATPFVNVTPPSK